jgi:hypothetical protein
LIIYHRKSQQNPFKSLPTSYNPATGKLMADMTTFGEFIIGTPGLEHVMLAPILIEPESQGTVNQELPASFSWTPRGFVNTYHLQVSKDAEFSTLVVDDPNLTETPYILDTVEADTTYYWRVSTINDAGTSEWSEDVFSTVSPTVKITVPNGGEDWQRGIEYFIQWDDNLAEDVVIELHKGGSLLQTIDMAPSTGAYKWEADLALETGDDYSIKVKSAVDGTLFDVSDAPFTIMDSTENEAQE